MAVQEHSERIDKAKKISKKKRQQAINKRRSLSSMIVTLLEPNVTIKIGPTKNEICTDDDAMPASAPVPLTLHIALPFFSNKLNEFYFTKK